MNEFSGLLNTLILKYLLAIKCQYHSYFLCSHIIFRCLQDFNVPLYFRIKVIYFSIWTKPRIWQVKCSYGQITGGIVLQDLHVREIPPSCSCFKSMPWFKSQRCNSKHWFMIFVVEAEQDQVLDLCNFFYYC